MKINTIIVGLTLSLLSFAAFSQTTSIVSRDVINDAATRPTLQVNDSNFRLGGVIQSRYGYSNVKNGSDSYGFENPFVRLDLTGKVGETFEYRVSPKAYSDGTFVLEDAKISANVEDYKLTVGQFRPIFAQELNIPTEDIIGPFRSVVSNTLGQTYTQGLQLSRDFDRFGFAVSFTDGVRQANTPIASANNSYGLIARGKVSAWNSLSDPTNLVFGAGIMHEDELDTFTLDASWRYENTWNANVAYFYSQVNSGHSFVNANTYNAITGELSYNFTNNLQAYVKHEYGHADRGSDLNISHLGVNYYLVERVVRWNNDVGFSYGSLDNTWNYSRTGFIAGDRQIVLSSQLQLLF